MFFCHSHGIGMSLHVNVIFYPQLFLLFTVVCLIHFEHTKSRHLKVPLLPPTFPTLSFAPLSHLLPKFFATQHFMTHYSSDTHIVSLSMRFLLGSLFRLTPSKVRSFMTLERIRFIFAFYAYKTFQIRNNGPWNKANVDTLPACSPVTIFTIVRIYYVNRIPFDIGTGNLPIIS